MPCIKIKDKILNIILMSLLCILKCNGQQLFDNPINFGFIRSNLLLYSNWYVESDSSSKVYFHLQDLGFVDNTRISVISAQNFIRDSFNASINSEKPTEILLFTSSNEKLCSNLAAHRATTNPANYLQIVANSAHHLREQAMYEVLRVYVSSQLTSVAFGDNDSVLVNALLQGIAANYTGSNLKVANDRFNQLLHVRTKKNFATLCRWDLHASGVSLIVFLQKRFGANKLRLFCSAFLNDPTSLNKFSIDCFGYSLESLSQILLIETLSESSKDVSQYCFKYKSRSADPLAVFNFMPLNPIVIRQDQSNFIFEKIDVDKHEAVRISTVKKFSNLSHLEDVLVDIAEINANLQLAILEFLPASQQITLIRLTDLENKISKQTITWPVHKGLISNIKFTSKGQLLVMCKLANNYSLYLQSPAQPRTFKLVAEMNCIEHIFKHENGSIKVSATATPALWNSAELGEALVFLNLHNDTVDLNDQLIGFKPVNSDQSFNSVHLTDLSNNDSFFKLRGQAIVKTLVTSKDSFKNLSLSDAIGWNGYSQLSHLSTKVQMDKLDDHLNYRTTNFSVFNEPLNQRMQPINSQAGKIILPALSAMSQSYFTNFNRSKYISLGLRLPTFARGIGLIFSYVNRNTRNAWQIKYTRDVAVQQINQQISNNRPTLNRQYTHNVESLIEFPHSLASTSKLKLSTILFINNPLANNRYALNYATFFESTSYITYSYLKQLTVHKFRSHPSEARIQPQISIWQTFTNTSFTFVSLELNCGVETRIGRNNRLKQSYFIGAGLPGASGILFWAGNFIGNVSGATDTVSLSNDVKQFSVLCNTLPVRGFGLGALRSPQIFVSNHEFEIDWSRLTRRLPFQLPFFQYLKSNIFFDYAKGSVNYTRYNKAQLYSAGMCLSTRLAGSKVEFSFALPYLNRSPVWNIGIFSSFN
jgi:hypothetical protein